MREDFDKIMKHILKWEGGYVYDSDDPGGETKYGISKRAHPDVDIRNLTEDQAKQIYKDDYWEAVKGDELPYYTAWALMDFAVNAGISRAVKAAQKISGEYVDGIFGPKTLARLKARTSTSDSDYDFCSKLNMYRLGYYEGLIAAKPVFSKYRRGWDLRVMSIKNGS